MNTVLMLGTRKGLLLMEKQGTQWQIAREFFPGVPVPYSMHDPRTDTIWASLDHGHWGQKLHRSRDWGETWEEVPSPRYSEGMQTTDGKPATLRYLWTIAPGGDDRPGRLYIGTEPGGLFRSDDGGDTFQLVEPLWNHPSRSGWFGGGRDYAGIHSVVVDPRDSNRVLVGISCGGVFETADDGASWRPINKGLKADFLPDPDAEVGQDPHLLVASPTNPDFLWQQNHCGIFRSTDSGMSWQDVSQPEGPARFGFAIAVDQKNPDTAWVVPAHSDEIRTAIGGSLCVSRTEDGGATWTDLRAGLPQSNCYDIVFRHALDVSGDQLAFGSTTGNFFVSADRGDSWSPMGNYLPPIHSVRFAVRS